MKFLLSAEQCSLEVFHSGGSVPGGSADVKSRGQDGGHVGLDLLPVELLQRIADFVGREIELVKVYKRWDGISAYVWDADIPRQSLPLWRHGCFPHRQNAVFGQSIPSSSENVGHDLFLGDTYESFVEEAYDVGVSANNLPALGREESWNSEIPFACGDIGSDGESDGPSFWLDDTGRASGQLSFCHSDGSPCSINSLLDFSPGGDDDSEDGIEVLLTRYKDDETGVTMVNAAVSSYKPDAAVYSVAHPSREMVASANMEPAQWIHRAYLSSGRRAAQGNSNYINYGAQHPRLYLHSDLFSLARACRGLYEILWWGAEGAGFSNKRYLAKKSPASRLCPALKLAAAARPEIAKFLSNNCFLPLQELVLDAGASGDINTNSLLELGSGHHSEFGGHSAHDLALDELELDCCACHPGEEEDPEEVSALRRERSVQAVKGLLQRLPSS